MRRNLILMLSGVLAVAASNGAARANTVVADFVNDFTTPTPKSGWSYEYSAGIGNSSTYRALSYDSNYNWYDATPGTFPASQNPSPDNQAAVNAKTAGYSLVGSGAMHPGEGTSSDGGVENFSIAAFAVTQSGYYTMQNIVAIDADTNGGDGVDVWAGVNNSLSQIAVFDNGGRFSEASLSLGHLNAGDVVYFAIGSRTNDQNDTTSVEFQIALPEPASLSLTGIGALALLKRRRTSL